MKSDSFDKYDLTTIQHKTGTSTAQVPVIASSGFSGGGSIVFGLIGILFKTLSKRAFAK